jgi:hypothetical protein
VTNFNFSKNDKGDKKGNVSPARLLIWVFVGGVAVYLIVTGLIGALT